MGPGLDLTATWLLFSNQKHGNTALLEWLVQEATAAIRPILGDFYNYDSRNVFAALWQDYPACVYVAPDAEGETALWYRK